MKTHTENAYRDSTFRFNGKEWDEETGNFYYGARYYDPRISVWLSVDPWRNKYPDLSPYNFVAGNPLRMIDPTGKGPDDIINGGTLKEATKTAKKPPLASILYYRSKYRLQGFFKKLSNFFDEYDFKRKGSTTVDIGIGAGLKTKYFGGSINIISAQLFKGSFDSSREQNWQVDDHIFDGDINVTNGVSLSLGGEGNLSLVNVSLKQSQDLYLDSDTDVSSTNYKQSNSVNLLNTQLHGAENKDIGGKASWGLSVDVSDGVMIKTSGNLKAIIGASWDFSFGFEKKKK